MVRLLLIDNYDSFTHNLEHLFGALDGTEVIVRRPDAIRLEEIASLRPDAIILSPGPKRPQDATLSMRAIERFRAEVPIFGVCLGMQCLNEAFGGRTVRAPRPTHGKVSRIRHAGRGLFEGVPQGVRVARYHSLAAEVRDPRLRVSATTEDGVVMALEHDTLPLWGVQFHPESFLTECGEVMARNFLRLAARAGQERGAS